MKRITIMTHLVSLLFWVVLASFVDNLQGLAAVATCCALGAVAIQIVHKQHQESKKP